MTRRRSIDNYKELPLSRSVTSLRLPTDVDRYVRLQGTGWLRDLITDAVLPKLQSDENDILQKA